MMKKEKSEFGLENLTDDELVERFNREVGLNVWVSARGRFFHELRQAIHNREWVYPETFMTRKALSLKRPIYLVGNEVVQVGDEGGQHAKREKDYLTQMELFIQCVRLGILDGYSSESMPYENWHHINGTMNNQSLKEYLKRITYDSEAFNCSIGTNNATVQYVYSDERGLEQYSLKNEWTQWGFCDRWDVDRPNLLAGAESIIMEFAEKHGALDENEEFRKEDDWELNLHIADGEPFARLRLNNNLLEEGNGYDHPFIGSCTDNLLPYFEDSIWYLELDFESYEGKVELVNHGILTCSNSVGFYPEENLMTPFQLSDLY